MADFTPSKQKNRAAARFAVAGLLSVVDGRITGAPVIADEGNVATCGHRRARGRVADRLYEIVDYLAAIIARGRAQSRKTGSRRPARWKRWWPPERP